MLLNMDGKKMITKEQFYSLYSDDITKKQYDKIIEKIDERFTEICKRFVIKTDKYEPWYDYGNAIFEDETSKGFFDPQEYKSDIRIIGEHLNPPPGYDWSFPTRWLWEDFEEELKQTVKNFKEQEKARKEKQKKQREERKEQVKILRESIKSKLTPQELKIIKFK